MAHEVGGLGGACRHACGAGAAVGGGCAVRTALGCSGHEVHHQARLAAAWRTQDQDNRARVFPCAEQVQQVLQADVISGNDAT